jgi:hemerythrin-like domain-containing protein
MANEFLNHLKKEHKEVRDILEQLENGDGNKEELFMKLKRELFPHLKAEEKVFYSALLKKEGAREDTLESCEEHQLSEKFFKEMEKISPSDERWNAKLKVLKELITHHMEEEERNLFKVAQKELGKDEFSTIQEKFEKESEKVKERFEKESKKVEESVS